MMWLAFWKPHHNHFPMGRRLDSGSPAPPTSLGKSSPPPHTHTRPIASRRLPFSSPVLAPPPPSRPRSILLSTLAGVSWRPNSPGGPSCFNFLEPPRTQQPVKAKKALSCCLRLATKRELRAAVPDYTTASQPRFLPPSGLPPAPRGFAAPTGWILSPSSPPS